MLEIELTTDTSGMVQAYFDLGQGISEWSSTRRPLKSNDRLEAVHFSIPSGKLSRLRLGPVNRLGKLVLGAAKIVNAKGQDMVKIAPDQFLPAHDIIPDPSQFSDSRTPLISAQGSNPFLEVNLPQPLNVPVKYEFGTLDRFLNALPVFLIVFLGVALTMSALSVSNATKAGTSACTLNEPLAGSARWLFYAAAGLALFKLWLVAGQTIFAIVDSPHDDQLFINLAYNILGGRWLGNYSEFTLMKGPMYSIFMAGVFLLGIPLFTAQHILYVVSCGLLVRALRPFRLNPYLLFGLFAVLLFNPVTYEAGNHTRILRQHLLDPLTLMVVAGGIALYARRRLPLIEMLPWCILTGVVLPAFWMTREEGLWILPLCALLWGNLLFSIWRERLSFWCARMMLCLLPFALFLAGLGAVSWLNYIYYDVFTICELKQSDFKAAYGSLLRIKPQQPWQRYVSISQEMRLRAYAVSPTFATLKPYLDPEAPAQGSTIFLENPDAFFVWDLRHATNHFGFGTNGGNAMLFYRKMAYEINEACDKGLLKAGPPRSGFLPPWRSEFTEILPNTLLRAGRFFVSFDDMSTSSRPSYGTPRNLEKFLDITRGRITPPEGSPPLPRRQRWLDGIRINILATILASYQHVSPAISALSLVAFFATIGIAIRRRRLSYFSVLSAGLIGSCLSLVLICALIETISFPAINTMYFSAGYGIWLLFIFTSWIALFETLRSTPSGDDDRTSPSLP